MTSREKAGEGSKEDERERGRSEIKEGIKQCIISADRITYEILLLNRPQVSHLILIFFLPFVSLSFSVFFYGSSASFSTFTLFALCQCFFLSLCFSLIVFLFLSFCLSIFLTHLVLHCTLRSILPDSSSPLFSFETTIFQISIFMFLVFQVCRWTPTNTDMH